MTSVSHVQCVDLTGISGLFNPSQFSLLFKCVCVCVLNCALVYTCGLRSQVYSLLLLPRSQMPCVAKTQGKGRTFTVL